MRRTKRWCGDIKPACAHIVGRWCGSSVVGDDLAQECFVELWQRRASYVPQGKFKAYLFHVAANRCKNQRRAQGRELALTNSDVAETVRAPSSDRFVVRERTERVEQGLAKLPTPQLDQLSEVNPGFLADLARRGAFDFPIQTRRGHDADWQHHDA